MTNESGSRKLLDEVLGPNLSVLIFLRHLGNELFHQNIVMQLIR